MRTPTWAGRHAYPCVASRPEQGQEQANPLAPGEEGPDAWKPKLADAPGARLVAHEGALAVQRVPSAVTVALQPLTRLTPDGMSQVTVQFCRAVAPVFLTVTFAVNPPCHELVTSYVTWQVPGFADGDGLGLGEAEGEAEGDADGEAEGDADGDAEGEAEGDADGDALGVVVV